MLLTIFGAGASYDSFSEELPEGELEPMQRSVATLSRRPGRPPTTNEIFTTRFDTFVDDVPEATGLIARLRRATRDGLDIEAYLESVEREADEDPALVRQLAAIQVYLFNVVSACSSQWAIETHGVTNYAELVERLRRWSYRSRSDHLYVTFNYDDLLDKAWSEAHRRRLARIEDYLGPPSLLHPHGSINWYQPVLNPQTIFGVLPGSNEFWNSVQIMRPRDLVDAFPELALGQPEYFEGFGRNGMISNWNPLTVGFPAIVIPLKTKGAFVCPDAHIVHLQAQFRHLTRVLIVAWRAGEDHFLRLWRDNQGDAEPTVLIACGQGDRGGPTAESLERWDIRSSVEIFNGGFSRLMESEVFSKFLGEV